MKVERILFPTDFSEGSTHAMHYAVDLAKHYNAKLYILHVIYDITKAAEIYIPHVSTDLLYKDLNEWALKEIDRYCVEEIKDVSNVEKKVVTGVPYEEIIKFAEEEKIDMIVMGSYGRVGIERFFFGSTAEKVVRRAPCPVMAVRALDHGKK